MARSRSRKLKQELEQEPEAGIGSRNWIPRIKSLLGVLYFSEQLQIAVASSLLIIIILYIGTYTARNPRIRDLPRPGAIAPQSPLAIVTFAGCAAVGYLALLLVYCCKIHFGCPQAMEESCGGEGLEVQGLILISSVGHVLLLSLIPMLEIYGIM
jgi:hypothetical protein